MLKVIGVSFDRHLMDRRRLGEVISNPEVAKVFKFKVKVWILVGKKYSGKSKSNDSNVLRE